MKTIMKKNIAGLLVNFASWNVTFTICKLFGNGYISEPDSFISGMFCNNGCWRYNNTQFDLTRCNLLIHFHMHISKVPYTH